MKEVHTVSDWKNIELTSKTRLRMRKPTIGNTRSGFLPKLSERGPASKVKTTEGSLCRNPLLA